MAGFKNFRALVESFENGKTWISTFRKGISVSNTTAGQWLDYSCIGGNPVPNYYASSPLVAATLEPEKGIILPRINSNEKLFIHRITTMAVAGSATLTNAQNQPCYLLDYLLYYPFVDMNAVGEDQIMNNTTPLPRHSDGIGVQIMVVAQSSTVGGGRFSITFVDSDNVTRTTTSMFCIPAQFSGVLVNATVSVGGFMPFVPLPAEVKGVKSITSVNFSVAHGGLCSVVLVKPIEQFHLFEESRRTTAGTLESFGDATEKEAWSTRAGMPEIKDGAFLGILGQGVVGSLASGGICGTLETVWG